MITRRDVLSKAVEECLKECYEWVLPKVTWEEFIEENKQYKNPKEPAPYNFYYLPQEVFRDIVDSYIAAYKVGSKLHDHLDIIVNYFNKPTRDKWIERKGDEPGYRSYEHFTPLKEIIGDTAYNKVLEYIEEARNYYSSDYELNSFSMSTYLSASPNSDKEKVIKYWKEYRNKDIEIDDNYWKREYYGEED